MRRGFCIQVLALVWAVIVVTTSSGPIVWADQGGMVFDEAISRSFTVLNRGVVMAPTGEAISRSFTVLNRPPTEPVEGEAISRAFTVLNRGVNPMGLDEIISRAFTVLNRGISMPPMGEAISRAFTINNRPAVCGNGIVHEEEACDDGNTDNDDGCSEICVVEEGFTCLGEPSECFPDCNNNGIDDLIDIVGPTSDDLNDNDIPDECCEALNSPLAAPNSFETNRYLQFTDNNQGQTSAIRLTLLELPSPYDIFNGDSLWVGQPQEVSENSASVNPDDAPAFTTFWTATLQCTPQYVAWSQYDSVAVYHELIVPDGVYELQTVDALCDELSEANYSTPLPMTTSRWGDVVNDCQTTPCGPPDDSVDIITDAVAVLRKFSNLPGAPLKARADLEPATPDRRINITDVLAVIQGFIGGSYPFDPPPWPCN